MELAERMALTKLGQVTWAKPELGKKCFECKYITPSSICSLVRVVSGEKGKPYDAKRAIACSKFEGVDRENQSV